MKAIVALGNPGPQYELTRHNYGWLVADAVLDKVKQRTGTRTEESFVMISGRHRGQDLVVFKPLTYMNLSGLAVDSLIRLKNLDPEDMIVVYDDIDIDFGRMKIASGGGDGGHKGIRSIINETGFSNFLRVRLGIKQVETQNDTSEFVLSPFNEEEAELLPELIQKAAQGCIDLLHSDPRIVMNSFNRK